VPQGKDGGGIRDAVRVARYSEPPDLFNLDWTGWIDIKRPDGTQAGADGRTAHAAERRKGAADGLSAMQGADAVALRLAGEHVSDAFDLCWPVGVPDVRGAALLVRGRHAGGSLARKPCAAS
jgi:hypothetical protein